AIALAGGRRWRRADGSARRSSTRNDPRDPRSGRSILDARTAHQAGRVMSITQGTHYLQREERSFVPVGAHYVPVEGPDWPWRVDASSFDAAFSAMAHAGLDSVRIDLLWSAVEPEPGRYDEKHLQVLDEVLEAARRY